MIFRDLVNHRPPCGDFCGQAEDSHHVPEPVACEPLNQSCVSVDYVTRIEPERIGVDDLLANVVYEAQGVPADVAADYIARAARSIAQRVPAIRRRWIITSQEGVTDYYLETHESERVELVKQIWIDGVEVVLGGSNQPVSFAQVLCRNGMTASYQFNRPDQIIVTAAAIPDQCPAEQIEAAGTVMPADDACVFDAEFMRRYGEAIHHRALADLFAIPKRKWSNNAHSTYHSTKYKEALGITSTNDALNAHGAQHSVLGNRRF